MAKDHPTGQSGLYQAFLQLKTPEQCYRCLLYTSDAADE